MFWIEAGQLVGNRTMSLQDNDTPHDLLLRIALETLAVSRRESQMKICAGASYYRDQHQVEYTAREICVSTVVLAKGLAPLRNQRRRLPKSANLDAIHIEQQCEFLELRRDMANTHSAVVRRTLRVPRLHESSSPN